MTTGDGRPLLLREVTLTGGAVTDVLLAGGRVAAVGPGAHGRQSPADAELHDLSGYLLLPAAAEPHAHLDKALLGDRCRNEPGDLEGAIRAFQAAYPTLDRADVTGRATRALLTAVEHGYTAVRTHATCDAVIGTTAVGALIALRERFEDLVDLQVVAMVGNPVTGPEGRANRAALEAAIGLGADLVGNASALDPRPARAMREVLGVAAAAGLPVDLHLDETTDASVLLLRDFASVVVEHGLSGRATASHCVSLGQQEPAVALEVARSLAGAGIGVVTLPQTNLYLQGRSHRTKVPRALTAVSVLREAGVTVAAGGDNWQDPFNPLGRIDPFETAALLVAAAHLGPEDAFSAVSAQARALMHLPPVDVSPGSPADFVAIRAASLAGAVAEAGEDRWVIRKGNVVSRTRVVRDVDLHARWPSK